MSSSPKYFTTKGMTIADRANLKGMTALYIMPAIAKEPAFGGILL